MFGIDAKTLNTLHLNFIKTNSCSILENTTSPEVLFYAEQNHKFNSLLWKEEDLARRTDVSDAEIAQNKRNIDRYNQQRNNFIEHIDDCILSKIPSTHMFSDSAWINSETAGSIIDRMSISNLRINSMKNQLDRDEASLEHLKKCKDKLIILRAQLDNLGECLDKLLISIKNGTAVYKVYRQFKMYNDPELNPYLYDREKQ